MARDPQHRKAVGLVVLVLLVGVLAALLLLPDWDHPPIASTDHGPPALEMVTLNAVDQDIDPLNQLSFPVPAAVPDRGERAGDVYGNVEVLGELDAAQFDRLMTAITEWVSPEQGCTFCHAAGADGQPDYAAAPPYTFEVARQMLRMVREVNASSPEHVMPQGVSCFSCHRGKNVPEYHWFEAGDWPPPSERWYQEPPPWIRTATTIRDFMPREAFELFILDDNRAAGLQARAMNQPSVPVASDPKGKPLFTWAENTYLFMMQMSDGLGVNCTACHNSRAFADWSQSTPERVVAWHAINDTRRINHDYIEPLAGRLPPERLGPVGDPAKANCMTCHVGQTKPLGGVDMISHFPGLTGPSETPP